MSAAKSDSLERLVRFSSEFTGVAARKLEFLQNQGGRVVDVVLEDSVRGQAYLDRWGRVTWSDKPRTGIRRRKGERV